MFGLEEILLIAVIAVIFLSPDNAPALANKIGKFAAKIKLKSEEVRRMVEKELKAAENASAVANDLKAELSSVASDLRSLKINLNSPAENNFAKSSPGSSKTSKNTVAETNQTTQTATFSDRLARFLKKDRRLHSVTLPPPLRHEDSALTALTLRLASHYADDCRYIPLPEPRPGILLLRRKLSPPKKRYDSRRIPLPSPQIRHERKN